MKYKYKLVITKISIFCGGLLLGTTIWPSYTAYDFDTEDSLSLVYNEPSFPFDESTQSKEFENYIMLDRSYTGFKEAIAFKESRGQYKVVNKLGYLGKYQFGRSTLNLIGIYDTASFLKDPQLQEKAFLANAKRNKWVLRRDIKRFVGQHINGTLITESGILAAAHLAGPGSVKRYLRSFGAIGFTDAFGTNISSYMSKFSSYDTSFIVPHKRPKAKLL